jgi:hypothetical protein
MTKVNNFWVPKIDSFKVWVRRGDIQIIDHTIIEKLRVIDSNGEIIDEIEGKSKNIGYPDGRAFKFWRRRHNDVNTKVTTEYIGIIINTKHLKERYFEGITLDNINVIVDEINAQNVIGIDKETLLSSSIGDLDICIDFPATIDSFKMLVKRQFPMVQQKSKDNFASELKATHLGLYLNTRDNCYPSKPFFKFYHKSIELENKSSDFAEKFLKKVNYQNIGRCEVNLKNTRHLDYHKIKARTLGEILNRVNWVPVLQKSYNNWFVQRNVVIDKKDCWKMILIKTYWKWFGEENLMIFRQAQTETENRNQKKKIMDSYNKIMKQKDARLQEIERIELVEQIDKFFRGKKRTYDVRTNVIESSTKQKN